MFIWRWFRAYRGRVLMERAGSEWMPAGPATRESVLGRAIAADRRAQRLRRGAYVVSALLAGYVLYLASVHWPAPLILFVPMVPGLLGLAAMPSLSRDAERIHVSGPGLARVLDARSCQIGVIGGGRRTAILITSGELDDYESTFVFVELGG